MLTRHILNTERIIGTLIQAREWKDTARTHTEILNHKVKRDEHTQREHERHTRTIRQKVEEYT